MLFARTQAEWPSLAPGTIPDTFGVNHLCVSETKQEAKLRKYSICWDGIALYYCSSFPRQKSFSFTPSTCFSREAASFFRPGYLPEPPQRGTVTEVSVPGHSRWLAQPDKQLTF